MSKTSMSRSFILSTKSAWSERAFCTQITSSNRRSWQFAGVSRSCASEGRDTITLRSLPISEWTPSCMSNLPNFRPLRALGRHGAAIAPLDPDCTGTPAMPRRKPNTTVSAPGARRDRTATTGAPSKVTVHPASATGPRTASDTGRRKMRGASGEPEPAGDGGADGLAPGHSSACGRHRRGAS